MAAWVATNLPTMPRGAPVNPRQAWLDRLTIAVLMRQVVMLADQAPHLTDMQLRLLLAALAGWVRRPYQRVASPACGNSPPCGGR